MMGGHPIEYVTKRQTGVPGGRLDFRMRQDAQDSKNANYLFLLMSITYQSESLYLR